MYAIRSYYGAAIVNPDFEKAVSEMGQSVPKKAETVTKVPKSVIRAIKLEINRINNDRLGLLQDIAICDKQLEELNLFIQENEEDK